MTLRVQKIFFILFFILFSCSSKSLQLSGEGYGNTQKEAQNDALTSLAATIFVQIESNFESHFTQKENAQGEYSLSSYKKASTDLPIIGAKLNCHEKKGFYCLATLDSDKSLPIYKQKLNQIHSEIAVIDGSLKDYEKQQQYRRLKSLLQLLEQADKYQMLIAFLSGESPNEIQLTFTRLEINEQLLMLEKKATSLAMAAEILARDIPNKPVYIRPASINNSTEVTPFASALTMQLKKKLPHVTNSYDKADFSYYGTYRINKNDIEISYSLVDREGNTVNSALVAVTAEAYANYRIEPLALDFDRLLHNGYALDNDFKVQVATNKGSQQLLFYQGETIKLMVKLNRPGYFYIVGHAKNTEQELSYLLEAGYGEGARKFIFYVNGDDANKWLSIGEFDVVPPFGIESLQVIAAEKDLINHLPGYRYDSESGYFMVSDNINEGLRKIRGLKKIKSVNTDKGKNAEAVLLFTTQRNWK